MKTRSLFESIEGCILGAAVGDAMGLPGEGLTRRRLLRIYPDTGRHHFLLGRGLVSDDTEHTVMVAQSLLVSAGEPTAFKWSLARELRGWLLMLPAGAGIATLKATLRLCAGVSPERSGVYSAGNGPAMRTALLGVCFGDDPDRLRQLVRTSTRVTHSDPKAEYGALAIAVAAHWSAAGIAVESFIPGFVDMLEGLLPDDAAELMSLVKAAAVSAEKGESTGYFAAGLGLERGVSGYIYATVPAVLHAWFRHPEDYRAAVQAVIRCGGDTDTTAAIVGAIVGARVGIGGIPVQWLEGLCEWPRSRLWMQELARSVDHMLKTGMPEPRLPVFVPFILLRNTGFLFVVLLHGFRRMLPPY